MADEQSISRMNREQLNERARSMGIDNPEGMKNADEVKQAITEREAQNVPDASGDVTNVDTLAPTTDLDIDPAIQSSDDENVPSTTNTNPLASPLEVTLAESQREQDASDVTVPGGVYIVNGKKVNANGEEVE